MLGLDELLLRMEKSSMPIWRLLRMASILECGQPLGSHLMSRRLFLVRTDTLSLRERSESLVWEKLAQVKPSNFGADLAWTEWSSEQVMEAKSSAFIRSFRKVSFSKLTSKLINERRIDPEKLEKDGWNISTTAEQLVATFPTIDPRVRQIMLHSEDIKIWRLYIHKPYPFWTRGKVALLGDAAHPMLPDQPKTKPF
jgi:hypothetical protein